MGVERRRGVRGKLEVGIAIGLVMEWRWVIAWRGASKHQDSRFYFPSFKSSRCVGLSSFQVPGL